MENQIRGTYIIKISANYTESSIDSTMVDHHNPAIKLVLYRQEVTGCIIDGGSGVNVISANTCE